MYFYFKGFILINFLNGDESFQRVESSECIYNYIDFCGFHVRLDMELLSQTQLFPFTVLCSVLLSPVTLTSGEA